MKSELLEISQYVINHPVINEKDSYKKKYVDTIGYFVKKYSTDDLWANSLLRIYKESMMIKKEDMESDADSKTVSKGLLSLKIKKLKFFSYRYCLLVDVMYICAFADQEKGKRILAEIKVIYNKRYWKSMDELFKAFYLGGDELGKFSQLSYIADCIIKNRNFLRLKQRKILVTANMSAGKSTLLNALIGKKVNKTQNETCTAKIHYLLNKAFEDGLNYELDNDLELNASLQILMEDNENNSTDEIFVGTKFRSLHEYNLRFCLIDTPGVNSSQEKEHMRISRKTISDSNFDMLLFVLNGQNIGTEDDRRHMEFVAQNYKGRTVFVINKLDTFKSGEDSIEETIESVKKDIESMGFKDTIVCPVSAHAAYLAKLHYFNECMSEDEKDEIKILYRKMNRVEYNFEKYYPSEDKIAYEVPEDNQDCQLMLHSGILSLESILTK